LKKIKKSPSPNALTLFSQKYPRGNWKMFRNSYKRKNYKITKALIFNDQGGLCAFCENLVNDVTKQQIEHFHSKKDLNSHHNWTLDWSNMIGVCPGGKDVNQNIHPLPANLSCDAYKDHLIVKNVLPIDCEDYLFNPLNLPAFPCLFDLDKRTGELKPKGNYDDVVLELENNYNTIPELVEKTIEHLNLNCDRLNQQRLAVLKQYNQEVAKARKNGDKTVFTTLANRWFQQKWLPFFTTRRILLGHHAENYLSSYGYNG
jgi:uncharacterized protein (TIGR02646 family)